ncbi:MAG: DMT family transporter [Lachnospiraceae bacterium]|nr:DMT family transporter [Lachnospiraceae bacterium]
MTEKTKGIICILMAAFSFALMNLFIKLAGDLPTYEKAFFRNAFALLFASAVLFKDKIKLNAGKGNYFDLIMRATFGTIGVFFNFYAIDHLNIGDASMLNKLSPFFSIVFSYWVLKEKAKPYQWLAVVTAILGAFFILKPGGADIISFPALIGLISGISAGFAYTFMRRATLNGVPRPYIVFFFSGFSTLVFMPFCIVGYKEMTAIQFLFLVLTAVSATMGQFSITAAYSHAKAADISVYDYTQIIFASLMGFFFLNEIPDIASVIGCVIIIGAGIFMFIKGKEDK